MTRRPYGVEAVFDLVDCDAARFTRANIQAFFRELCEAINMEMCESHFWDDVDVPEAERQTHPDTKGTSAVCFILTSSIVVHALDLRHEVFVNIFSCKEFDPTVARGVVLSYFGGAVADETVIERGRGCAG